MRVISRARGQSAVAAAAYRAACSLRDRRYNVTHDFTHRRDVSNAAIACPPASADWVRDREMLWNRVEAAELRKDAQLARAIEVSLPLELSRAENVALLLDYVAREFTALGMIVDVNIHWGASPKGLLLLTLRRATAEGFGPKERAWNERARLNAWREVWADVVNEHLARAGHAVRIDHRTLAAQQIELLPSRNLGPAKATTAADYLAARASEQRQIVRHNGLMVLEDPAVLLRALTHQRPNFSRPELLDFVRTRCEASQYDAVLRAVEESSELVALPSDDCDCRYTSRDMVEAATSMRRRATAMAGRRGGRIEARHIVTALAQCSLGADQRSAFEYLVGDGEAKAIAMTSADKLLVLTALRLAWDARGGTCVGAARSMAEAEALQSATQIAWQPYAIIEQSWIDGRDLPRQDAWLMADAAETLSLKQLERLLAAADRARAKALLIADAARLASMKAQAPFHVVWRDIGWPGAVVRL